LTGRIREVDNSKQQSPFGHNLAGTADVHSIAVNIDLNPARASQSVTLLNEHRFAIANYFVRAEKRTEWTGGAACGRILPDPDRGVKETSVSSIGATQRIQRVDIAALRRLRERVKPERPRPA
jgi:hypothetical protein